eukprot:1772896-Rhodomonas_salina.3
MDVGHSTTAKYTRPGYGTPSPEHAKCTRRGTHAQLPDVRHPVTSVTLTRIPIKMSRISYTQFAARKITHTISRISCAWYPRHAPVSTGLCVGAL